VLLRRWIAGVTNCSAYVGSSNWSVYVDTLGAYSGTNIPVNSNNSVATTGSVIADITYDYTLNSTPEPATMGLMGSALIGLALVARKFRR
jgi:hypothetical protein